MKFYKNLGMSLLYLNFTSVFFLLLVIFIYSIIQYLFEPLVNITQLLFSEEASRQLLYRILDIVLIIPSYLDYMFLLVIITAILNILYIAWKTEKSNIYITAIFSLIGLPTFIYFLEKFEVFKDWALGFLSSAITYNINMRFFNYVSTHNIELTIVVFLLVIAIRSIDWQNVKLFKSNSEGTSNDTETFNDIIQQ